MGQIVVRVIFWKKCPGGKCAAFEPTASSDKAYRRSPSVRENAIMHKTSITPASFCSISVVILAAAAAADKER